MVRFKNRHLLVEFLTPSTHSSTIQLSGRSEPSIIPSTPVLDPRISNDDDDDEEDDILSPIPSVPFLVPNQNIASSQLKLGDEGTGVIFRAIRSIIQEVFGDEGWGRVAASFKGNYQSLLQGFTYTYGGPGLNTSPVVYYSPLTTLTMMRIARQHYRIIWAGITLLNSIMGIPVLPRVLAISGTIKKLQNKAIGYHRLVMGQVLVALTDRAGEIVYPSFSNEYV